MNAGRTLGLPGLLVLALCLQSCADRSQDPATTVDPRVSLFAALPDWRGYWVPEGMKADISGYVSGGPSASRIANMGGEKAPWKPEHLARIAAMQPELARAAATGKSEGWGYPMMMESFAPLQFLITPEETLILNFYRDVRHVYTDGRSHPAPEDLWPTPWGDSIGRWEGDTLVIETVAVQRPGILFVPVPLVSERARYTERIRRTGPDRIESEMTIEDPETLASPWVFRLAYERQPGIDRLIHEVFDNDRVEVDGDGLRIAPPRQ